jgi:hypothetical protein
VDLPLAAVLAAMELAGVALEGGALRALSADLGAQLEVLQAQVWREAGREFNLASPKQLNEVSERAGGPACQGAGRRACCRLLAPQLGGWPARRWRWCSGRLGAGWCGPCGLAGGPATMVVRRMRGALQVLFGELGLSTQGTRATASGRSVDADALEALAGQHPAVAPLLRHRQLARLKGGFVDSLAAQVDGGDGRLRCTFNQAGTSTGRWAGLLAHGSGGLQCGLQLHVDGDGGLTIPVLIKAQESQPLAPSPTPFPNLLAFCLSPSIPTPCIKLPPPPPPPVTPPLSPPGSPPPSPTCRTCRCAARWRRASAAPSRRRPAGCCCPPTTARLS